MDEILNVFRDIKAGSIDSSAYPYDNINVIQDGQSVHIYDVSGTMPCGRYKTPPTEAHFLEFITKMNEKVTQLIDDNAFICGKCGLTFDLPETKRDKHGNLICEKCASGGDIRGVDKKAKNESEAVQKVSPVAGAEEYVQSKPTLLPKPLSTEEAIAHLQKQGFVVKKLVKSYKVVYTNGEGQECVSNNHFRDPTDFENTNPGKKFVAFIKELSKADEENL